MSLESAERRRPSSLVKMRALINNHQIILFFILIFLLYLLFRKDIANKLGFNNFAEMSMETKMAASIENVMSMINRYVEFMSIMVIDVKPFSC